nr:protealysin inhibitor emfourin [Halomonas socia]
MSAGTESELPPLGISSRLSLRREGGIAHFPGLAQPRFVCCDRLGEAQRERLRQLLAEAVRCTAKPMATDTVDRRRFHLAIEDAEGRCQWSVVLDEQQMPEALLRLWRDHKPLSRG